jgi:Fe-S cluster biogenesis protein NfuA
MENQILEVLETFRKTLQLDGADLQVSSVENQKLDMELVIQDQTCLDCIVPKSTMKMIIEMELKKAGLQFAEFELVYPIEVDVQN